ncbi:MAG TPA: T9SS type A sorting domain-containing protein [Saprospiraceae bacterium]|nr:T9SS type A sorting domain-containing protein [Saprospiraceae bacterium]
MSAATPYELYADGFRFENGTIQLNAGQEKIFNIASGGNTISIRSRQVPGYPNNEVVAGSIEACGNASGEASSLGVVRMFEEASLTPWSSRACIEIRDQYSSDRIMEIPRGLGRYHLIDRTQNRCEFSLMYQNETGIPVEKIELTISPGSQFDMLTFRECAASHGVNFELFSAGQIRVTGENMHLAPGDQFQYRFALELIPSGVKDFISIEASGVINDTIPINFYGGFYNRNKSGEISGVSPFVSIENGKIIGRSHTWEFDAALQVQQNGTVLYAGSTSEFGVDGMIFLLAMHSDNTISWQHTYAFKEGGGIIQKIIPGGEGRFLLIGSVDDNQVADNYINDAYAFMLMLDENGREIWRNVWKPGIGTRIGGSLNNGHFYNEDKILLLGFRYTPDGARQFIIEINMNGDIHWIRDFTLGSNTWGDPVTAINDIPMKVSPAGNIFIVTNSVDYYTYFVKLDAEAHILDIAQYEASEDMQSISIKDFVILNNEEVLLVGDGYSYDPDFNFTVFGILIRMDDRFRLIEKKKILEESYSIELDNATLRDSTLFVAGAIQVDSSSNNDAIIIRSDLKGENAKILRIADFGARDYASNVNVGPDGRVFASVQTQTIDDFYNLQMGFFWVPDTITSNHDFIDAPEHIQLFPNPAKDIVNIISREEIIKVKAVAMSGTVFQLENETYNTYNVKLLAPGNYLLVVYTSSGTRYIAKLVKVE